MNNLFAMKGEGKRVIALISGPKIVDLVTYADGSFGIRDGEVTMGTWEHEDLDSCVWEFLRIIGWENGVDAIVLLRSGGSAALNLDNADRFYN